MIPEFQNNSRGQKVANLPPERVSRQIKKNIGDKRENNATALAKQPAKARASKK